jgi:dethiobiotin synthetase
VARLIFVTGTDTGVGKTVLTALLLRHMRGQGIHALAMKPFCTGSRSDVELIQEIQNCALPPHLANPFYFPDPVAPLVAARRHGKRIPLSRVIDRIHQAASRCDCLLVEGAGGVLVPLGPGYSVADLIRNLPCEVFVVARNQLGTINHTLLTVGLLKTMPDKQVRVVLMGRRRNDPSTPDNERVLRELAAPAKVFSVDFLGSKPLHMKALQEKHKNVKKILARILA